MGKTLGTNLALLLATLIVFLIGCASNDGVCTRSQALETGEATFLPIKLPAPLALRDSMVLTSGVFRHGSQYVGTLPHQLIAPVGDHLSFTPDWHAGGLTGAAYALYAFDSTGYSTDDKLHLTWLMPGSSYGVLWIGLANFEHNRWDWFAGPESDVLAFNSSEQADFGRVCAVVLCLGSDPWELKSISISADMPPVVKSVSPLEGFAGSQVTFSAEVVGSAGSYSWNFGGGAVPDTSTEAFPSITLSGSGIYSGTVAVSNSCGTDTFDFVLTITQLEVHIFFSPAANGGAGTLADAYALSLGSSYTFTAEDQLGADITPSVTFTLEDESGGPENDPAYFSTNVLHTGPFGFGTIRAVGIYRVGQPDEVRSDPDLLGEGRYFVVQ